ncbi:ribosomal protein S18 acetylase RimI-like enzyme [Kitasatospora sp. MAA19]|uniref:GNAT family N-acetyltransferase n=1 Tax=Kitasatospora sp. MAA19 TaxID=3035090 RepID=UPI0024770DB6|nr:GNAT family N-acetyltransferase [Kitasatospora sp. MAA19]MDH6708698.1 ribosomal protein S18 acetylase RimI-like enzyme [Kitasatospora sp. MAA19]
MTTTLRPEGPETPTAAGGRTRRWQICANGRQVGALRTTAVPHGSQLWGEIAELEVREGRGRGRGTFGALAAEEVLRGWGCTRVDANIPEPARIARALAATLGYTERMRNLAKRLTAAPALPTGVTADRIGPAEFPAWLDETAEGYIRSLVESGLSEEQARAKSHLDHLRQLPQGADSPGVVLRRLRAAGGSEPLGSLWVDLHLRDLPGGEPLAWVMVVEVSPAHRGRGHGRTLMLLAERECLAAGVHNLGLNVFSDNEVAIRLYASLGYRVTNRIYGKSL